MKDRIIFLFKITTDSTNILNNIEVYPKFFKLSSGSELENTPKEFIDIIESSIVRAVKEILYVSEDFIKDVELLAGRYFMGALGDISDLVTGAYVANEILTYKTSFVSLKKFKVVSNSRSNDLRKTQDENLIDVLNGFSEKLESEKGTIPLYAYKEKATGNGGIYEYTVFLNNGESPIFAHIFNLGGEVINFQATTIIFKNTVVRRFKFSTRNENGTFYNVLRTSKIF